MKSNSFKWLLRAAALFLVSAVIFVSCKKDKDDPDPQIQVEDGIYIVGNGTALTDYNIKGLLKSTRNEVNQSDRSELMEIYIAVKAGSDGFNIKKVAGATRITYGPGSDFTVVGEEERIGDEPQLDFWRGSYVESATPFTVPADGLYHVVIDTEVGKVAVIPVQFWGLIGAATSGGWSNDTKIYPKGFDLNTMTFEADNITMTKADFKFRYSSGWKVVIDDDYDLGGGVKGIKSILITVEQ